LTIQVVKYQTPLGQIDRKTIHRIFLRRCNAEELWKSSDLDWSTRCLKK